MAGSGAILVLTRAKAASEAFGKRARDRFPGLPIVIVPATRIAWLKADLSDEPEALIFTSANGVRAYARISARRHLPAFCLGPVTAAEARAAGLAVTEGPGTAQGLAETVRHSGLVGPFLWPRGESTAFDIAADLSRPGHEVTSAVVYRQEMLPPPPKAKAAFVGTATLILPLFSPMAARAVLEWRLSRRAPLHLVAISQPVADAAQGLWAESCVIAGSPDSGAMLESVGNLVGLLEAEPGAG